MFITRAKPGRVASIYIYIWIKTLVMSAKQYKLSTTLKNEIFGEIRRKNKGKIEKEIHLTHIA